MFPIGGGSTRSNAAIGAELPRIGGATGESAEEIDSAKVPVVYFAFEVACVRRRRSFELVMDDLTIGGFV
jgi:hypothetical protein